MDKPAHQSETEDRRSAMLRTAFCSVVREALEAPDTIEIMANPDGSVWIETTGIGVVVSDHRLAPSDRERVIRLVASGPRFLPSLDPPLVLPASESAIFGVHWGATATG